MPSSAVRTFADPDDYAASIRGADIELTITGRGDFDGKLVRIDLHDLWMQRYDDNLPRIWRQTNVVRRAIFSFLTRPGPSLVLAGSRVHQTDIIRRNDAQPSFQRSDGRTCYGSMSLPLEQMASLGAAVAGCDLTPPKDSLAVTPPSFALTKLRQLHEAAGQVAEHAPEVIANPDAARGLEQALIGAMLGCLSTGELQEDRAALRQHAAIMRRFDRVVEEHLDEPLYVPELCTEVHVSERTLRVCCEEHLGMSPKRYLLLRRMSLARRALGASVPTATTVTEIATRYGFWQFGRFSGEYRSLFGELPSTTLARPPD